MSKEFQYHVRKHRAIQLVRKEEIEQIEEIIVGSNLQDDTLSSIKSIYIFIIINLYKSYFMTYIYIYIYEIIK